MKLNIFGKLYLAVLLATGTVIVFMVVVMNWNFREGFAEYQRKAERDRVVCLAEYLAGEYRSEQNSWSFVDRAPRRWRQTVINGLECQSDDQGRPTLSESAIRGLSGRLRLLDENGQWVQGRVLDKKPENTTAKTADDIEIRGQDEQPYDQVAVVVNERIVGYLQLILPDLSENTDDLASSFMQQQARNLYLIAGFAALLSLLVTLVVVRQFLVPVKKLTDGAKSLSQGLFSTHIAVTSNDELGELARRFNQLADFLRRNEELRAQWIADVSHELRTPLSILRSEIEAMLDGIRQPDLERIRSLHTETLSLSQLVDDLYQLSLSDAGDIELPDEIVDVNDLLHDLLRIFATRLNEKQIRLLNVLDSGQPLPVRGDDKRLYQLFSNLLENSNRYTDTGGSVQVSAFTAGGQLVVEIADSAPGVPDAALPRLFDRLFRVDKSRSRVLGGSGLGLSICRNIVMMHNGRIEADHSGLGGLLIRVYLPLASDKTARG
ncbi:MAG: ATP-binding protein [Thiolinea sp.]